MPKCWTKERFSDTMELNALRGFKKSFQLIRDLLIHMLWSAHCTNSMWAHYASKVANRGGFYGE
ncbi:protein of unknown function (plasmid) [Azospirillum baldaniorum]|uniref:Uncharacterized protein n=1 Tax=Azospirillum baldaniorum TaxID=1064539 RepID=A0A9P1K1Z5_9PROT|nr:protein of unknown function [Azospirillum baldaniorum]